MKKLLFLHNSGDRKRLQMLVHHANQDEAQTGFHAWIDAPDLRDGESMLLDASDEVHIQIETAISNADAIVYCVGSLGAGPYQAEIEAPLVRQAMMDRANSGKPIQLVPVLLNEGQDADLPEWARGYSIVNHDRTLKLDPAIWGHIKLRLLAEPELDRRIDRPAPARPSDLVDRLAESLASPARLTVYVGPYAMERHGNNNLGPAALTRDLLRVIGIHVGDSSILPWPSEAAGWLKYVQGSPVKVYETLLRQLAPLGHRPPSLVESLGYLAQQWIARHGERGAGERDWYGLLILTTRVDLALESTLTRQHAVGFTRILPTLNNAKDMANQRRMVQQWHADENWYPDPTPGSINHAPSEDIAPTGMDRLPKFSLDKSKRIIIIKLCGSLEIPESLVLTGQDFFENSKNFESLPSRISEIIRTSPHLFVGRGFASPLAQLVKAKVFPNRGSFQPRVLVMPEYPGTSASGDPLCDLELDRLNTGERELNLTLEASAVHRGPEHVFVRHLAERL